MSNTPATEGSPDPDTPGVDRSDADELARLRAENQALQSRLDRRASVRKWTALVLVVLTSISTVATTMAAWAHETLLDNDRFMEVVEPALDEEAFYSALSDYTSDQALIALSIEERIEASLGQLDAYLSEALVDAIDPDPRLEELLSRFDRPSLTTLAPSITASLEDAVRRGVDEFITSEAVTSRFPELVRQAHAGAVALVTDQTAELPNVYIAEGEVRLNLIPIITEALRSVVDDVGEALPDITLPAAVSGAVQEGRGQLARSLQAELPEDFGQVTVMSEDALAAAQEAVRRAGQLVWALAGLTLLLAAATVAVSQERRRTVVQAAVGIGLGLVLAVALIGRFQDSLVQQAASADGQQAIRSLFGELISSLRSVAAIVVVVAFLVGVGAYLAGRPAWLTRARGRWSELTRREDGPSRLDRLVAARSGPLRLAGAVVAALVLIVIGFGLIPFVLVVGLLALYLWAIAALSRQGALDDQETGVDRSEGSTADTTSSER